MPEYIRFVLPRDNVSSLDDLSETDVLVGELVRFRIEILLVELVRTESARIRIKRSCEQNRICSPLERINTKEKEMTDCKCFTCTHKSPTLLTAYYTGYIEACDWFLKWAEANGIKMGSIGDDDIGGIYAQIRYNRDETSCLLDEVAAAAKDMHRKAQKAWAERNRPKVRAIARRYYKKNSKRLSERSLKYYYKRKAEAKEAQND